MPSEDSALRQGFCVQISFSWGQSEGLTEEGVRCQGEASECQFFDFLLKETFFSEGSAPPGNTGRPGVGGRTPHPPPGCRDSCTALGWDTPLWCFQDDRCKRRWGGSGWQLDPVGTQNMANKIKIQLSRDFLSQKNRGESQRKPSEMAFLAFF